MHSHLARGAALPIALVLLALLTISPSYAGPLGYVENFASAQYRDTLNTTALWDTLVGELKLPPYELTLVGSYDTPGAANDAVISGDYAYVTDYAVGGLQVIDISDPTAPALAGSYNTPGTAYCVAISGDYAYVTDNTSGLQVIDISDPTNPTLAGNYNTPDQAYGVAISGDYAYVGDMASGLQVIDVSDPTNPTLAGSYDTSGAARGVAISGDYAFVTDYADGGLQVIDISDPTNPTLAGSYDTSGNASDVAISGDYAYVASLTSGGLLVIDISDPTTPTLAGSYDTPGNAYGVAISGDYAYVGDQASGLQVIDISDPTNLTPIGSYDTPDDARGVAISGDYAYVADATSGLQVIRIADPVLPPEYAGVGDTSYNMYQVVIAGDYAYIATASYLAVFDISTPESPTLAGSYAAGVGAIVDIVVEGNYAYIAKSQSGLLVVDISDPTNPIYAGSLSVGWAKFLTVQGNYVYVCIDYSSSGFKVIDISDPTNPALVGSLTYGVGFGPVAVDGNWAYAASGVTLVSVDISNPSAPVLGGTYVTPGDGIYGITVAGDYAYVADGTYGVHVLNISDPTTPGLAGNYDTPGAAFHVAIAGDYANVADWTSGFQLLDISDPTTPTFAASYSIPGNTSMVAVAGDYAFVAAHPDLHVLQVFQRTMDFTGDVGQSFDVNSHTENIMEAKLATTQNDTITWEMSADAGSNWQGILPDGSWNQLAFSGNDFRWRSAHIPVNLRTNPTCTSLQFDFMFEFPQVDVVEDIPNDQGRQVSISWTRSSNDFVGSGTPITEYAIYREVDPDLTAFQAFLEPRDKAVDPRYRVAGDLIVQSLPPGSWHFVMSAPALAEDNYATVVPTLADSTISDGIYCSTFIVLALTATPGVYFESPPDSGYSLDNLAPSVPQGFSVAYNAGGGNQLDWESASEEDFRYCCIYRSTNSDFTPAPGNLVHTTVAEEWFDPISEGWQYHYKITAVDFSGNESDPTAPGTTTGITDRVIPQMFALHQNLPNPFSPTTLISYDVPEGGGFVTLQIYDVSGRSIRMLVNGVQAVGQKTATWNGKDDQGQSVAAGVYLYRLRASNFQETRTMILLR